MGSERREADCSVGEWRCLVPFLNLGWASISNDVGCVKDALRTALLERSSGEETRSNRLMIGVSRVKDA